MLDMIEGAEASGLSPAVAAMHMNNSGYATRLCSCHQEPSRTHHASMAFRISASLIPK